MTVSTMEEGSYREFSARLHAHLERTRTPVNVTVEISHRCPLACIHCYNNLPMGDAGARSRELTLEEHKRLLDGMVDLGALWLLYTGGEVFARPDFLDIYTYARRKGFIVTLFTNGTLITPRIADALAEWRPFAIEITLYGATKETYEAVTRVPGSFEACLRGIRLLKERGLPLVLKSVAIGRNWHELPAMKRFAEETGTIFRFDAMMSPRLDCSQSPLESRLTPAEIVGLDLDEPERVAAWAEAVPRLLTLPQRSGQEENVYNCGAGVVGFSVDPFGKMRLCAFSQSDAWDLRSGSVAEGWQEALLRLRQKKITRVTKCTACQLKSLCGMCPANAELENRDPEAPIDFFCHVAHLRALVLVWHVPPHGTCEYCEGGARRPALEAEARDVRRSGGSRAAG